MKQALSADDIFRDVGEERFRLIAQAGNDVIWDWNIETSVCWQSQNIRQFGYSEVTQPGERPWLDHVHPDHFRRVLKGLEEVLASDRNAWSDQYPFLRCDASVADILNRACLVRNADGRAIRMVGAMIDGTGRKQATDQSLPSPRILGRRAMLQPNDLIHELVNIIGVTFPKSISVKTECDPAICDIEGDALELHQVLANLCANARNAMPDGGTLVLSTHNVTLTEPVSCAGLTGNSGQYAQIEIADTGTGMSEEIQEKIFQPYFTTKHPGTGAGLGLATVVRILKSHAALLSLESEPKRGTTISVYFPVTSSKPEAEIAAVPPAQTGDKRKLVLLVDDEKEICDICQSILECFDYRVLTAENGLEALSVLERHKDEVSAAVVDMRMPVMDGPTAIRAMRSSAPRLKIILTSGLSDNEQTDALGGAQPDMFLKKPYSADQLVAALAKLLH